MKRIENFMLPEHHNELYKNEAISSMTLARDVADKINELVNAYNEFSLIDLEWKHEQEGRIRKGVLYMKDNLLNSLNDLMEVLRDSGFIDERIEYHCNVLNERLNNLLGKVVTGTTSMDAEIIDARVDIDGTIWETVGEHIRGLLRDIGTQGFCYREIEGVAYNNLNDNREVKAGDRIYVEPISITTPVDNIKYITVLGMYGELAEDGYDILTYILPDNIKPIILTMDKDYLGGIRITYNLNEATNTYAYGIIKKLTDDLTSYLYENNVKLNQKNNYYLFEPVKMRYGAHQGYRTVAPANSLPAYEEMGKAGFEWAWIAGCRQSADGTWFVMHDSTVDGSTNGSGAIKEMTDTEIEALVIDNGVNVDKYSNEELKIPTLEEVINICRKYGTNVCFRMMSIYTNASGVEHFKSFIDFVKKHGVENGIFSGNLAQIKMLKAFTDNWHGQVYVDSEDVQDVYNMIDNYVTNGWTNMSILATFNATDKEVVEYCHSKGYKYCVSDIPDELDVNTVIDELLYYGVDICQSGGLFKR